MSSLPTIADLVNAFRDASGQVPVLLQFDPDAVHARALYRVLVGERLAGRDVRIAAPAAVVDLLRRLPSLSPAQVDGVRAFLAAALPAGACFTVDLLPGRLEAGRAWVSPSVVRRVGPVHTIPFGGGKPLADLTAEFAADHPEWAAAFAPTAGGGPAIPSPAAAAAFARWGVAKNYFDPAKAAAFLAMLPACLERPN